MMLSGEDILLARACRRRYKLTKGHAIIPLIILTLAIVGVIFPATIPYLLVTAFCYGYLRYFA